MEVPAGPIVLYC